MNLTNLQLQLEQALKEHHVAGASIAVYCQGDLATASSGTTNITTGIDITHDTVMCIGSITKVFNATLIMQLVDEGRINLDDPVLKYLPELKLRDTEALGCITVKMLINHTSGIDGELLPDHGHDEETIEKAVARFAQLGQIHTPGAEASYCNVATIIAGYLAQRVTSTSWYDLVKEKIYAPLGMEYAVTLPEEALLHRASVGHYYNPEARQHERASQCFLPLGFSPAGSTLMMSAADLMIFARTHINNGLGPNGVRILSESSAIAMRTPTAHRDNIGAGEGDIGLGWMINDNGVIYHAGGVPGVVTMLYVHPEKNFAAAILTNGNNGKSLIDALAQPWLEEVTGTLAQGTGAQGIKASHQSLNLQSYIGTYENISTTYSVIPLSEGLGISTRYKFAWGDDVSLDATEAVHLTPAGEHCFLVAQQEAAAKNSCSVLFKNPDAQGRMQFLAKDGRLYRRALA